MDINLNSFDPRMVKVFQAAIRFTSHMKHEFIGSEHLLWALSQDPGAAGQALFNQEQAVAGPAGAGVHHP